MNTRRLRISAALLAAVCTGTLQAAPYARSHASFEDFQVTLVDLDPSDAITPSLESRPTTAYAGYYDYVNGTRTYDSFWPTARFDASSGSTVMIVEATPDRLETWAEVGDAGDAVTDTFTMSGFTLSPHTEVDFSGLLTAQALCYRCAQLRAYAVFNVIGDQGRAYVVDIPSGTRSMSFEHRYTNDTDAPLTFQLLAATYSLASMSPVPEPPTWLLGLAGLAFVGGAHRRARGGGPACSTHAPAG
ncbi:PEP-CTERM domain protein [Rubrivivax gelatinosus]|uniref:PEP-CTERM domain protein n=1 Tax=Rubrivivax gelatinosus TaxID=28068 RepID=UPI0002EAB84B|nr:PEP-CTERM domain protein [Rubrivivax gelatinosus]MBG6079032.1 hypothetical protein [Rubrivivax gelatinosus]